MKACQSRRQGSRIPAVGAAVLGLILTVAWCSAAPPKQPEPNLPALLNALDTSDRSKHSSACEALLRAVRKKDMAALVRAGNDHRPGVRAGVLFALTKFSGHPMPEPPYVAGLFMRRLQDKDVFVRRMAAGLAWHFASDCPDLVNALVKALDDPDKGKPLTELGVAAHAATSLSGVGVAARPAYRSLMKLAERGDENTRVSAMRAVGRMAEQDKAQRPLLLGFLIRQLRTRPVKMRGEAAFALSMIGLGARPAIPALREAFKVKGVKNPQDRYIIQGNVLGALRAIGPEASVALADALPLLRDKKTDLVIRDQCVQFITALGEKGKVALPLLRQIAGDAAEESGLRNRASQAIEKLSAAK